MRETPLQDLLLDIIFEFECKFDYLRDRKGVEILVPAPFLHLLQQEIVFTQPYSIDITLSQAIIQGYSIRLGYEMAIVMYHVQCTFNVINPPLVRIPLMPGVSLPNAGENYNRVMFKMQTVKTTGGMPNQN